jgi:hypothetical protein
MTPRKQKNLRLSRQPAEPLRVTNPHAAGIDVHAAVHWVAVPPSSCPPPPKDQPANLPPYVRKFGTCTADLEMLADWLAACGVTTVAMEATGIYWIALLELLERFDLVFFDDVAMDRRAEGQLGIGLPALEDLLNLSLIEAPERETFSGERSAGNRAVEQGQRLARLDRLSGDVDVEGINPALADGGRRDARELTLVKFHETDGCDLLG